MKDALEIIIEKNGVNICHPFSNDADMFIDNKSLLGERLLAYCSRNNISFSKVSLFVSEELLFFKSINLPLKTRDIKQAVEYQLDMLIPFPKETMLFSYTNERLKENYRLNLVAVNKQLVEPVAQEVSNAGYIITGLFPESQRYINRLAQKSKWALVLPGRFSKVYTFIGSQLEDRFLCGKEPSFSELTSLCKCDTIYHQQPVQGSRYQNARELLEQNPILKDFNMLPESFRQPDYFKVAIVALIGLNLAALLVLGGIKGFSLIRADNKVENAISEIMPQVNEVNKLRSKEDMLLKNLNTVESISKNPDLIGFLKNLSEKLPESSYLDQMRMDKKSRSFHIQGYTENVGELTTQLQSIGESKLKSTSRRRNRTYFQVEISLP